MSTIKRKELAEVRLKDLTSHGKIVDTLGTIAKIAGLRSYRVQ